MSYVTRVEFAGGWVPGKFSNLIVGDVYLLSGNLLFAGPERIEITAQEAIKFFHFID